MRKEGEACLLLLGKLNFPLIAHLPPKHWIFFLGIFQNAISPIDHKSKCFPNNPTRLPTSTSSSLSTSIDVHARLLLILLLFHMPASSKLLLGTNSKSNSKVQPKQNHCIARLIHKFCSFGASKLATLFIPDLMQLVVQIAMSLVNHCSIYFLVVCVRSSCWLIGSDFITVYYLSQHKCMSEALYKTDWFLSSCNHCNNSKASPGICSS